MTRLHTLARRAKPLAASVLRAHFARQQAGNPPLCGTDFGLTTSAEGTLHVAGHSLKALGDEFGTPLHVVDAAQVDANAKALTSRVASDPRAGVYYSYKTNPVPAVLRRLHGHGIGAEVISPYEYWLARHLGVTPDNIIFNGPAKTLDATVTAIRDGTKLINANSLGDAVQICAAAEAAGTAANVGIRIALSGSWTGQFGIASSAPEFAETVELFQDNPLTNLIGVHSHRGISMRSVDEFTGYVTQLLDELDELRDRLGFVPELVDLGGSIASPTSRGFDGRERWANRALGTQLSPPDPSECITLEEYSRLAFELVSEHYVSAGLSSPEVVIEPGRSVTSNCQILLASVLEVKTDQTVPHAILDAGMNIAEPATGERHEVFNVAPGAGRPIATHSLVGPICTPADVLYHQVDLPKLEAGDTVAIMDAGAYFVPFSTSFSYPRPPIVVVDEGVTSVVRRRERFEDVIALDIEPIND